MGPPSRKEGSEAEANPLELDILVVDDRRANLIALESALQGIGANLVPAKSGEEALRLLLRQDFALVLLDVQMPKMDGFETARLLRARPRSRHLPIIFITAFDDDRSSVLEGYGLGAVDFLTKPIIAEMLRAKVTVFLELERRNQEILRQSELLRQHEQREHERLLEQERTHWRSMSLQLEMDQKSRLADELSKRATELANSIAEQERTEEMLVRINRQLAEADRRKDEFIAVLAHELRNPLAPMTYALELLDVPGVEDEGFDRARQVLDRQLRHITRLIDDLLDVSRVTSGKVELKRTELDLCMLVGAAIDGARFDLDQKGVGLEVELPTENVRVVGDGVRLTQVITNLLGNAGRYTGAGGKVRVLCSQEGDDCVIRVSDSGEGIRGDLLESIFEPFVQDRPGHGGLGIGLALVRSLVALHGGIVNAESEGPGHGATFTVRLPVASGSAITLQTEAPLPPVTSDAKFRIAIIEDQPDISDTLAALLIRWGHTVQAVNDGHQGVKLVLRSRPHIALVDIGLPIVDGYDVARQVKAALGDEAPLLVAITGYGQQRDLAKSKDAGFDHHLVKPVRPDDLRRVLFTRS